MWCRLTTRILVTEATLMINYMVVATNIHREHENSLLSLLLPLRLACNDDSAGSDRSACCCCWKVLNLYRVVGQDVRSRGAWSSKYSGLAQGPEGGVMLSHIHATSCYSTNGSASESMHGTTNFCQMSPSKQIPESGICPCRSIYI